RPEPSPCAASFLLCPKAAAGLAPPRLHIPLRPSPAVGFPFIRDADSHVTGHDPRVFTSYASQYTIRCGRTTIDIQAPVLKGLKDLRRREGGTLGALVSRLLAEALARRPHRSAPRPFTWTAQAMAARVDVADKDTVYEILDRPARAAEP